MELAVGLGILGVVVLGVSNVGTVKEMLGKDNIQLAYIVGAAALLFALLETIRR